MKNKKLVIIGAGEIAKNAYEYFTHDSEYEVVAFSVSNNFLKETTLNGLPVVTIESIDRYYPVDSFYVFVAIGETKLNISRSILFNHFKQKGYRFANYISSRAFVWGNVEIGQNCFILQNNVLEPFVKIGNNVTLWSGNHVGHRSIINNNCFITSHVVISGFCEIGENSFLGINSSFSARVKVAKNNFIAMGSVVNKNTLEDCLYAGNPAKSLGISAIQYCGGSYD